MFKGAHDIFALVAQASDYWVIWTIAFVKNEGTNLNAMISALMYDVSYDIMVLEESFNGSCFGHVFSKAC